MKTTAFDYNTVADRLSGGMFAEYPVRGDGMRPFLYPGLDHVLLSPMRINCKMCSETEMELHSRHERFSSWWKRKKCRPDGRTTIRRRDVVLCATNESGTPSLYRVAHIHGTLLLLRKDGRAKPYESATVSDVLGVVIGGTFRGGRPLSVTSRKWRYASRAWGLPYKAMRLKKKLF